MNNNKDTIILVGRNLDGSNGYHCKTGNSKYSFDCNYKSEDGYNRSATCIVSNIDDDENNAKLYSVDTVKYHFCGEIDESSIINFKKIL